MMQSGGGMLVQGVSGAGGMGERKTKNQHKTMAANPTPEDDGMLKAFSWRCGGREGGAK